MIKKITFLLIGLALFQLSFKPLFHPLKQTPSQSDSLKIELGRILFYDPQFSKDGQTSCASCHSSYQAFAHTDHAVSHGVFDSLGTRNAPGLFNLKPRRIFMRDGAIHKLELQALAPLHSAIEMGGNIDSALQIINHNQDYRAFSFQAWGDSTMTVKTFLESLAMFERSLLSINSYWDKVQNGKAAFTPIQKLGQKHFNHYCQDCHTPPLFQSETFYAVWDTTSKRSDLGRFNITHNKVDRFAFLTPSLRNLSFTYPYAHDGSIDNLYQCMDLHQLPYLFQSPVVSSILDDREITELVAFLLTLNDTSFIQEKKYQFPKQSFLIKRKS
jgi:cytochrome c peroxidase